MKIKDHLLNLYCMVAIAAGILLFGRMWFEHIDFDSNWKNYYDQSTVFGKNCDVSIEDWRPNDSFEQIKNRPHNFSKADLPYRGTSWLPNFKENQFLIAKCQADLSRLNTKDFAKINLGPLFGHSVVYLYNRLVYESSDNGIADFNVLPSERYMFAEITIISKRADNGYAGPGSLVPFTSSSNRIQYEKTQRALLARYTEMPLFRIGLSLVILLFFAAAWIKGMRYPDVAWIIILSTLSSLNDYLYLTQMTIRSPMSTEIIRISVTLAQIGFVFSFIRNQWIQKYFSSIFIILISLASMYYYSTDGTFFYKKLEYFDFSHYVGVISLFVAGVISLLKRSSIVAPKQRLNRLFLTAILTQLAGFAYFLEDYLSEILSIKMTVYIDACLLLNFAIFLAIDLIVFQKQYFEEKAAHAESQRKTEIASARGEILGRFLSQSLVSKFTDQVSMNDNLETVLTPRLSNVALLQADIRGYSELSKKMNPLQLVMFLQKFYQKVIDHAQKIAQVKLIGDCIFLFIEDNQSDEGKTSVDQAIEIAALLANETQIQNTHHVSELDSPLNFGIAIHYGEVVTGNLSSEQCIDYTVIGENVNFVARLEEFTKRKNISEKIGQCGVLLSTSATNNMKHFNTLKLGTIKLVDSDDKIRSFTHVEEVRFMTKEQLLDCATDSMDQNQPIAS